jgi:hypothetical protein
MRFCSDRWELAIEDRDRHELRWTCNFLAARSTTLKKWLCEFIIAGWFRPRRHLLLFPCWGQNEATLHQLTPHNILKRSSSSTEDISSYHCSFCVGKNNLIVLVLNSHEVGIRILLLRGSATISGVLISHPQVIWQRPSLLHFFLQFLSPIPSAVANINSSSKTTLNRYAQNEPYVSVLRRDVHVRFNLPMAAEEEIPIWGLLLS